MTAVFEFTDRARPVVQFGRSEHPVEGEARWGTAHWGVARWGRVAWDPIWTDVTCEIHEITVDVGRAGAVDRFKPGTAAIVASNINNLSDMVWPPVIPPILYEEVPQPPIEHEEDLQAPDADTVTSNGWSFTDDFETRPPRWRFPPAFAGSSPTAAVCGLFKAVDGAWEPELYEDHTTGAYVACAAAQWTQTYDTAGNMEIEIVLDPDWKVAPTGGTPELRVDLCVGMTQSTRECLVARFRFVPQFPGVNEVYVEVGRVDAAGAIVASDGESGPYTFGTGTNGVFGRCTLGLVLSANGYLSAQYSPDLGTFSWVLDGPPPGGRVGLWMSYTQGTVVTVFAPRIEAVVGADFADDLTRRPGSGWRLPGRWAGQGYRPVIQDGGALHGSEEMHDAFGGDYHADGVAQWVSEFVGDQYVEVDISDIAVAGIRTDSSGDSRIYLLTHMDPSNGSCMVAEILYDTDWNPGADNIIFWYLWQQGPNFDPSFYAGPAGEGEINLGPIAGAWPASETWRVESDLAGEQRLYRNGHPVVTVTAPNPATGPRIGVRAASSRPAPGWPDTDPPHARAGALRVDRLSAGLQSPLGTEELGTWIRIGVDHDDLGNCWLFRGFVDGIVPTYVPDRPDAVRLECIDALGEAGRVQVDGDHLYHQFAAAPTRIRQILDAAHWPAALRDVHDDSTLMSRPPTGTAVEALTRVAESCGGAVYGDPVSGHVVFRGRDWQGHTVSEGPVAAITNFPDVDITPQVCPVGWEMSKRRSDIITRVRFTSVTSDTDEGTPIVREWRSPQAERIYGVELYEATLLCITGEVLSELAVRELRIEGARDMPRIEACLLDASTADEALDLMATATFTRPTTVRCQLHRPGNVWVINRNYIVTGQRHVMKPERWTCRLALDLSSPFYQGGGRWGERLRPRGRWGVDVWARNF